MEASFEVLVQAALIIAAGVFLGVVSRRTKFPFIVLLILAGTFLASVNLLNLTGLGVLPDLVRVSALVVVVFSSSFYIRLGEIKKTARLVLSLSTLGLFLTLFLIAGLANWLLGIPLVIALFLGAVLAGTDIAALGTAFQKGAGRVQTVLAGEAIVNTPLTVILPLMILDFLTKSQPDWWFVPFYFGKLIWLVIAGLFIGVLGYIAGSRILSHLKFENEEIAGLMVALGVYVVAELVQGSGILAVAVTGVLLNSSRTPVQGFFAEFHRELAFLFTIFVFIMLGMEFTLHRLTELSIDRFEILVVLGAILFSRLLTVGVLSLRSNLSWKERLRIGLVSPKGLAPAALAPLLLAVPGVDTVVAEQVVKLIYIAIILSVFVSLVAFTWGRRGG